MYISNSNTVTYFDWLKGKGENLITNATLKNIWKARSSYSELLSFSYGTPPVAASEKPKYIVYLLFLFHWIDLLFDLSVICKSIWQNHEPNYLLNTGETQHFRSVCHSYSEGLGWNLNATLERNLVFNRAGDTKRQVVFWSENLVTTGFKQVFKRAVFRYLYLIYIPRFYRK